ncbi:MAG: MATE family efflux transporter [Oscillospiraceae bacterium]|nr:MATE family efflux transporter [Oscillospiraceae bacterium]
MAANDFSKGSVLKNIISLALPMTLAQLINILYNIIDRIYIGRLGADATLALTGLGVCLPAITIVTAFANLVGMGGAPLFSIERGAGHDDEAEAILGNSFTMLLVLSVILTVSGFIFKIPLLRLLGASDETLPFANSYLSIYLLGNLFVMASLGLNSFINAQGFGKTGMMTVIIGAALNIILDPIFIFALDMGVRGAAAATVISQLASAVWTFSFLTGKRAVLKIRPKKMKCTFRRVKKITVLGLAGFTMSITNSIVQMAYNVGLQKYGGDVYIGAMTIINSIREFIHMPIAGFSNGAQPVIGFNYGAGKNERVKTGIKWMSGILTVYTLFAWLMISLFPKFFIGIFSSDPEIIYAGAPSMHIYFFGFFMMALQSSGQSTFTALGKSKQAIFFSIFRKVIIVTPLIFILPHWFGVDGVFLSEPISNFIGGAACFITMLITVYRKL